MNQNRKYSPNGYYDIHSGNIQTVAGDTVLINHKLIVEDLPDDISNTESFFNVLTMIRAGGEIRCC